MTSKFNGICARCNKAISKGTRINWEAGQGARHLSCDQTVILKDGKTLGELALQWDREHKDDLTACQRVEQMMNDRDYRDVPEDALWQYARQDTQRNPYR